MSEQIAILVGVFIGGAIPWLEAVVVIPGGIVAGGNPVLTVIAGVTGNLLTVAIAAWFGERLARWWRARRQRGRPEPSDPLEPSEPSRQRQRIMRVVRRGGMPALATLGPIGLGTQVSVLVAVSLGVSARAAFLWIGAGTVGWAVIAAVATVGGLSMLGIGD